MGLRLHCDRCGMFVKNVGSKEFKQMTGETICGTCKKMEDGLAKFVEGLRNRYIKQMNELIKNAHEEIKKEVADLTEG